jgi:hypothetical protein
MERFRTVLNYNLEVQPDLRVMLSGEYVYDDIQEVKCYDEHGNFMFTTENKKVINRKESKFVDNVYANRTSYLETVFQRNYNFEIIKMLEYSRVEELNLYNWKKVNGYVCSINDFIEIEKKYNLKKPDIREMCMVGTKNYSVFINLGKKIIDFDYNKYTRNKEVFIENNPKFEWQVDYIYNQNLKIVANFFMVDVKYLPKLDKSKEMIKRLMFNINNRS